MKLSEKDGQLFYKLWLPLLDYVNKKCKVNRKLKNIATAKNLEPSEVKEVANVLWDDISLIDQYLAEDGADLLEEHRSIVSSWKHCVQGHFIMERHLKSGTIFISEEGEKVYQVYGIISSWEEMFQYVPMPLLIEATFIPFRDVIISDGLVASYPIVIGKNMAKQMKNIYMEAKKKGKIIRTMDSIEMKHMLNKKWKKFSKLTEKCYANMVGAEKDWSCWTQAFELLKEIVLEERQNDPNYASQLEMLDDVTDYEYDIQGWLEDCLDEIDMREDHEDLLNICNDLLSLFGWPEYTGSDIKLRKSIALSKLGNKEEAVRFCKEWLKKEPENIVAATSNAYAFIDIGEFKEAEKLVNWHIPDKNNCSEETYIMFTAASLLYEVTGMRKEKKQIDKALKKFDEYMEQQFMDFDMEDEEMEFWQEELPFN